MRTFKSKHIHIKNLYALINGCIGFSSSLRAFVNLNTLHSQASSTGLLAEVDSNRVCERLCIKNVGVKGEFLLMIGEPNEPNFFS
jgi:hypothetical protein